MDCRVKINGQPIPDASNISVSIEAIDYDSGRGSDGVMQRNLVRQVYTLDLTYDATNFEALTQIKKLTTAAFFQIEFYSPYENARISKTFYRGSLKTTVSNYVINIEGGTGYASSTTINFVER